MIHKLESYMNKIGILGTVFGSVLLSFGATVFFIPNAYAINDTEAITWLSIFLLFAQLFH